MMKHIYLTTIALIYCISAHAQSDKNLLPDTGKGFALVELFTSEGCSSCPPADALVNELQQEASQKHLPVFILNFHVDYWNYLGWNDPFSNKTFSAKQSEYNGYFDRDGNYTPQMVINGSTAFVGSYRNKASAAIHDALKNAAKTTIDLHYTGKTITYTITGNSNGHTLYVAYTEAKLTSKITAGENKGKTIFHSSVVKSYTTLDSKQKECTIPTPYLEKNGKYTAIVWLQNNNTKQIVGANSISW